MHLNVIFEGQMLPSMEKKIMKPAEIRITLLLPTLVDPRRPTFSLCCRQTFRVGVRHGVTEQSQNEELCISKVMHIHRNSRTSPSAK